MGIRTQANLGRIIQDSSIYRTDAQMHSIILGKVINVNHQLGECDVVTTTGDKLTGVKITQEFSGYDEVNDTTFGSVRPICKGTWGIFGFLDSRRQKPIMLTTLPNLNTEYFYPKTPVKESKAGYDRSQALKTLNVYPSRTWTKIDGDGNIEFAHSGRSFFAMYNTLDDSQNHLTDGHLAFDFEDLSEYDDDEDTLASYIPETLYPTRMLFTHRTHYNPMKTTWTKFYLNEQGLFRLTRDNNDNALTFMELKESGAFKIKRLIDSPFNDESEISSEFILETNGDAMLRAVNGASSTMMGVTSDLQAVLEHSSGGYLRLGDNLELEVGIGGKIYSESLSDFIRENHLFIGYTEPEEPPNHSVWIDLN